MSKPKTLAIVAIGCRIVGEVCEFVYFFSRSARRPFFTGIKQDKTTTTTKNT